MKEVSVRLSMGATRGRLVRQLLTENIVLASVGGVLGLLVAAWGKELLPDQAGQAPLDLRVFLFAAALTLLTGIVFGVAPALRATRTGVNTALKEGSRNLTASRTTLGKALVVVQVAVSLLLLIGAGLFLRTVQNLRRVEVGFNPRNIVLFRVNPRLNQYDQQRTSALYKQMMEDLNALPGVKAVSFSSASLLSGSESDTNMLVQGGTDAPNRQNMIDQLTVSHNFFETMEIPFVAGRTFTATDTQDSPKAAVINETAAKKFFPNENPLGRRFGNSPETRGLFEIVGVVRDAKYNSVRDSAPPTVYFLISQRPLPAVTFEVRTASDPAQMTPAIRGAVRRIDANLPLIAVSTQLEQIDRRSSRTLGGLRTNSEGGPDPAPNLNDINEVERAFLFFLYFDLSIKIRPGKTAHELPPRHACLTSVRALFSEIRADFGSRRSSRQHRRRRLQENCVPAGRRPALPAIAGAQAGCRPGAESSEQPRPALNRRKRPGWRRKARASPHARRCVECAENQLCCFLPVWALHKPH